jgi:hypothetical protein
MGALFPLAESWEDGTMNRTPRTRPARFATRLAGLALTAVALTACGGEADEPEAGPSETPTGSPTGSPSDEPADKPTKKSSENPAGPRAEVTIKGGAVTPVAQSVDAAVGEKVTLEITSDRAGELHVHATPEQYQQFDQGRSTVEMVFDKPGAVDVEEHESGALVLRVLVK